MKNPAIRFMAILTIIGLAAAACKPKAPPASLDAGMATPVTGQSTNPDSGIRYVVPKDGLNLRAEPSVTGRKILTIPKGEAVLQIESRPPAFKIDEIEGKWTKISWQGKTGWVFGGFLSTSAPASTSSSPQSESGTSDDSQCKNRCEQERMSACIHINCGREGVVCRPNEEEDCWNSANKKAKECTSKCS